MPSVAIGKPGSSELLLLNEAIARGALEAGVSLCAGYPGTPSSEIIQTLIDRAKDADFHVEWSVNEKVAVEVAAAAAFSGLKSLASMKNAGASVAMDTFLHLSLSGIGDGAMVVIIADDPQAHASGDEMDTRFIADTIDVPLLVPTNAQEAKDMTMWAFDLSHQFKTFVIVRSTTRLSHSRNGVTLGEIPAPKKNASFDTTEIITPYIRGSGKLASTIRHGMSHDRQTKIQAVFEKSDFNTYSGPDKPELLIIACGSGYPFSVEAVEKLNLADKVGILKLGTVWPLPRKLIEKQIAATNKVLVVEEVDPFIENHIGLMMAEDEIKGVKLYGKFSGHVNAVGELTPDIVINAISGIFKLKYKSKSPVYTRKVDDVKSLLIERGLVWCPGCPHRATFMVLRNTARSAARKGIARPIISGDIGCYTMDQWTCGTHQTNACLAMGSSVGMASGFGELAGFGLKNPVIAVVGDSTFFHAAIPALINGVFNKSKMCTLVLDNSATAMTGFQPHPGTGNVATGEETTAIAIEDVAKACGIKFIRIIDPFDPKAAAATLEEALQFNGPSVVISRAKCALLLQREKSRRGEKIVPYVIDQAKCNQCNVCVVSLNCPAIITDKEGKLTIDRLLCNGCSICAQICPRQAIVKEEK